MRVRVLSEVYNKHLKKKLFNKILLVYSLIIIVTLTGLSIFAYQYFSNYMTDKAIEKEQQLLDKINNYYNQEYILSKLLVENIYRTIPLINEISLMAAMDYNQYLNYSYKKFLSSSNNQPITKINERIMNHFSVSNNFESLLLYVDDNRSYMLDFSSVQIANVKGFQPEIDQFNALSFTSGFRSNDYSYVTVLNHPETFQKIGILALNYSSQQLMNMIGSLDEKTEGHVLVIAQSGEVILDSRSVNGYQYPVTQLLSDQLSNFEQNSEYITLTSTNNTANLIIARFIPTESVYATSNQLKKILFVITSLLIFASLFITYTFIKKFSRRTRVIVKGMEKMDFEQMSSRLPLEEGDELYQISYNFNRMIERLNQYIDQVYISEIKQKNAEIEAMQMKINPHFLYNTLEAIRMKAVAEGMPKVGNMIFLLASLFRHSMRSGMIIPISEEIEQCKTYLDLFQIRYTDRLEVEYDIDPEINKFDILKFTIQPIIENYVLHGFRTNASDNKLMIKGGIDKNHIYFEIIDNGKGILDEKLKQIQLKLDNSYTGDYEKKSIGISNVNDRLTKYYGEQYKIQIQSQHQIGTQVKIILPIKKERD